ncbi:putative metallophosphoesterase [Calothrix sp. NIES-2100]|uniref:metallophosphoesterase n=1 Tax=Calothrix sp. NIES-2100 TaxID=1954172 RepID=UPI000B620A54|nr:putative metallophosphoesterase [Calothrix sp. NIES-2100]
MKIQIYSDLHIEFQPFTIFVTDADVIVLAGDIHLREKGVKWAIENIQNKPVIYVLGNHEYYGSAYPKLVKKLKNYASGTNVYILENDWVTIKDVTFLGCTLWTDFKLFDNAHIASYEASQNLTDFKKIRLDPHYSKLKPIDTVEIHRKSVSWLKNTLSSLSEKIVVVTHHAPSKKSLHSQHQEDILSAAYASNLDDFVDESDATLWIHGHIHKHLDYRISSTRIICNPRGYPDELNTFFEPEFCIEI